MAITSAGLALVGFNGALPQPSKPLSGAWVVVDTYGRSFTSKNEVRTCEVKSQTSPRAELSTTVFVAGPMTQDECNQYNGLSSIDSKIARRKHADAHSTTTTTISRIDGLAGTARLIDPGDAAIRQAAVAVSSCAATP